MLNFLDLSLSLSLFARQTARRLVATLHKQFVGDARPALIPSRLLLHDGFLSVQDMSNAGERRKKFHVWLFNDIVVWGEECE